MKAMARMNITSKSTTPILMGFPLRGEWYAPNTPGTRIPSHGTNRFGTRYAYDFIQVDWHRRGLPAYKTSFLHYLLCGVRLESYYAWGQPIYAPCDGVVVKVEDGYQERTRTNSIMDMRRAYKNAHSFDPSLDSVQIIAGNYIIIKHKNNIYAALCHLQKGTIHVCAGQSVKKGEYIGNVGHSGNSFAPHLHFQLMDDSDITKANGLPCAFEYYEVLHNGVWESVQNGIPTNKDRIRFQKNEE